MADAFKSKSELTGLVGVLHRYSNFGVLPTMSSADLGFFDRYASDVSASLSSFSSSSSSSMAGSRQFQTSSMSIRGPSAQRSSASHAESAATADELEEVPPFLRKLVALIPRKSAIANMDVDFVIRSLTKGSLPPPPVVRSFEPTEDATRKRKHEDVVLGSQGAPTDAFKQRQQATQSKKSKA